MKEEIIPLIAREFLDRYVRSPQQLEVLVAIAGASRKAWTAEALAAHLGLDASAVTNRLINLWTKGLVKVAPKGLRVYSFNPARAEDEAAAKALAEFYQRSPEVVRGYLGSQPD